MTGAASELEDLPIIGPAVGAKLQRTMRAINAAQARVGQVASMYSRAVSAASQVQERIGALKEQAARAGAAINRIAGKVSPSLANILPTGALGGELTPAAEAVKPFPHLLILQPWTRRRSRITSTLIRPRLMNCAGKPASAGPRRNA